jgi:outer membrane protein, heavy metal efflux system
MNVSIIPLLVGSYLLLSSPVKSNESLVLTESQLAQRIRSQNPDILAARLQIDEALGRMKNAGRLENPSLQTTPRFNATSGERGLEFNLSQKFPITQRLRLEKDLSVTEVQSARWEIFERENQLIGEALSTFVRLVALRQRRDLLAEQTKLAGDFVNRLEASATKGEASMIDVIQTRLQTTRLHVQAASLAAEEQQFLAILHPLLGMEPSHPLSISGNLSPLDEPQVTEMKERPALHLARLATVSAEQDTALQRAKHLSDISVGFVAGLERNVDEPIGAQNEQIVGLQLVIPLPLWNRNEGIVEASVACAERRSKEHLALQRKMNLEASATKAEMSQWRKLVEEIDTKLLPLVRQQTEFTEQALSKGQAQPIDLFRCREQLITLQTSRLDAVENFHIARARFKTIQGTH